MLDAHALATVAVVLTVGIGCSAVAQRVRVPAMLLLLAAGIVLGPSGLGVLEVRLDAPGARLALTLGVCLILFEGGLALSIPVLRRVALGLGLLVIPGVIATAVIVGVVAAVAFGVPLAVGLLVGAVLSPTDPAILVPLFQRLGVRSKVSQTVIAESALNDATGAALVLALIGAAAGGGLSVGLPLERFVEQVAISSVTGCVAGLVLAFAISHGSLALGEFAALLALATVAGVASGTDAIGGSAYLGAFLAGVVVGNMDHVGLAMHNDHEVELRAVSRVAADMTVIVVFIVVGMNLPVHALGSHMLGAVAVLLTLVLVARPVVVLLCLGVHRRAEWTREELLFIAATRETGVMAAALAALMSSVGVRGADLVLACVALVVPFTLLVQATAKPWLVRRLRLGDPTHLPHRPASHVHAADDEPRALDVREDELRGRPAVVRPQ